MTDPTSPVRAIMSRGTISVDERLTLRSLAAVLAELDVGAALVTHLDTSVGVVSERDLVRAIADGADPDEVWAADVTVRHLVIAEPEEAIVVVAQRMVAENVRHIPIVDRGRIVGVASVRDVLPVLTEYLPSDA